MEFMVALFKSIIYWVRILLQAILMKTICLLVDMFACGIMKRLAIFKFVGGAYMWDLTFYLANTPPLPVPRLDVDIGTLLQTDRSCRSALATNSVVP